MSSWLRFGAAALMCWIGVASAEPLSTDLTGVWASDGAVMNGSALMSGQALYLGTDGAGAFVGGPPPIGFKVTVVYLKDTAELEITAHEGAQFKVLGRMRYDPSNRSLVSLDGKKMNKRFDALTDDMRKSLGLPIAEPLPSLR